MKTVKERIDAIDIDLRYGGGPADPFITITRIDARMLVDQAKEAVRLQNQIGALEDKDKLLRKALEFYADEGNHKAYKREAGADHSIVSDDGGQTAKEALRIGEESNAL